MATPAPQPLPFDPTPSAPAHLLPSATRPTEASYATTVHLTASPGGTANRTVDGPLRMPVSGGLTTSNVPAVGLRLTHKQAWEPTGLARGTLLHSLCLAPGEMTRVAMVDWHHQDAGTTSEDGTESSTISQTGRSSRVIRDVTTGVATESQHGRSDQSSGGSSGQVGASAGFLGIGASAGTGHNHGWATSVSRSDGSRKITEQANQQLEQSARAHADDARSRRATVVKEVSQAEGASATTRIVANYNHGHALTMQYFEVLETFSLRTTVEDAERLLFLPMELLDLQDPAVLHRHRTALRAVAHTELVADLLDALPRHDGNVQLWWNKDAQLDLTAFEAAVAAQYPGRSVTTELDELRRDLLERRPALTINGIRDPQNNGEVMRVPADAVLTWAQVRQPDQENLMGLARDASIEIVRAKAGPGETLVTRYVPNGGIRVGDIARIDIVPDPVDTRPDRAPNPETQLILIDLIFRSADGQQPQMPTVLALEVPADERNVVLVVNGSDTTATTSLSELLEPHALRYSQAVWSAMDPVAVHQLLAGLRHDGHSLAHELTPEPVAVTGNMLGFRWPFTAEEVDEVEEFQARHVGTGTTEVDISIPTGGVFAEAVLGESIATEPIDTSRFWKWQDSPIPNTPSEIAPVSTDTRAEDVDTGRVAMGPTVQAPSMMTMPGFDGGSRIAAAMIASNMFRDMSGMAGTAASLQQSIASSSEGAQAASKDATANMKAYMDFVQGMAKEVMPMVTSAMGGPEAAMASETMKGGLKAAEGAEKE